MAVALQQVAVATAAGEVVLLQCSSNKMPPLGIPFATGLPNKTNTET